MESKKRLNPAAMEGTLTPSKKSRSLASKSQRSLTNSLPAPLSAESNDKTEPKDKAGEAPPEKAAETPESCKEFHEALSKQSATKSELLQQSSKDNATNSTRMPSCLAKPKPAGAGKCLRRARFSVRRPDVIGSGEVPAHSEAWPGQSPTAWSIQDAGAMPCRASEAKMAGKHVAKGAIASAAISTCVTTCDGKHDLKQTALINEFSSKIKKLSQEVDPVHQERDKLKEAYDKAILAKERRVQDAQIENMKLRIDMKIDQEGWSEMTEKLVTARHQVLEQEGTISDLEKELEQAKESLANSEKGQAAAAKDRDDLAKELEAKSAELERLKAVVAPPDAISPSTTAGPPLGREVSLSSRFLNSVKDGVFRVRKDTNETSTSALKRAEELTRELIRYMNLKRVSYVRQVVPTDLDAEVTASLDAKYKDATADICMKYFDRIKDLQRGTTDSTTKSWTTFLQRLDTIVQSSPSTASPPQTSTTPSQAASPLKLPTCPITPSSSFNANTCPSPTPNPSSDNEVLYSHTVRKPRIFDLTLEEADEQADHASELAAMRAHYERLLDKAHAATAAAKAFSGMMGCARAVLNIGERFGDVSGRGM